MPSLSHNTFQRPERPLETQETDSRSNTGSDTSLSDPFLSFPSDLDQSLSSESLPPIEAESDYAEFNCSVPPQIQDEPEFDVSSGQPQLETTGVFQHDQTDRSTTGELWKSGTLFKLTVAAKLRTVGANDLANTLDDCHSKLIRAQCTDCRTVKAYRNHCDNFWCPECQPRLARKRQEGLQWWVRELRRAKFVTLTLRNTRELQKSHVKDIKYWFTKLRRRAFCKNWIGGMYSIEVTNEGKGWHLHLHALVDAGYIDARQLSLEWNSVTSGSGYIVKVKDASQHNYLKEVAKYTAKGSEIAGWPATEIATFIDAFDGVKTFGVFGNLHGKRTEWKAWIDANSVAKKTCECGCEKFKYFDEQEWEASFCKRTNPQSVRPPPSAPSPEFPNFLSPLHHFSHE